MYAGVIVEEGACRRHCFARPRHPYTHGLIACVPDARPESSTARWCPFPAAFRCPPSGREGCDFAPALHPCRARPLRSSPFHCCPMETKRHPVRCVRAGERFDAAPVAVVPAAG